MSIAIKSTHPEFVLSEGEHEGFQFLVAHNGIGFRCGYVRVPAGHPWHRKEYDNIEAEAHGGLTYSDADKDDDSWWVGFDCEHSGDDQDAALLPTGGHRMPLGGTVKTQEYVESECLRLCEQAVEATKP